jgi:hypothetical protein
MNWNTASNVVFVVSAIFLVGWITNTQVLGSRQAGGVAEGDVLPALPDYSWESNPRTLVLALQVGCRYCEDSAPFYRRLADLQSRGELLAHAIAIFPDPGTSIDDLDTSERLDLESRAGVRFTELGIRGTPTLLLVSSAGRVLHVWNGQLTSDREATLIELLRAQ